MNTPILDTLRLLVVDQPGVSPHHLTCTEIPANDLGHFQAQLGGFALVLDAATGATAATSAWLRALHETICAHQETFRALTPVGWQDLPLPRGEYKHTPNHVRQPDGTWHSYAPPGLVTPEVQRLVDETGTAEFVDAHPVVQAAYVHHAFVGIHPFADGNGRVARAVASVYLYRAARVPLLVFSDQRVRYLAALRAADRGDRQVLIGFVREVTIDAIELVLQALRTARTAGGLDLLATLGDGGTPPPDENQLHFLASRLEAVVQDELRGVVTGLPADVLTLRITPGAAAWPSMSVEATSRRGAGTGVTAATTVGVSPDPSGRWPLQVVAEDLQHRAMVAPMRVRLGNLFPALTAVTQQRIRQWVQQLVNTLAAELVSAASQPGR